MSTYLTNTQRKKARAKIAKQRGVSESTVTDQMIYTALSAGEVSYSDCGVSTGGFDSGSSGGGGGDCGGGF